MRAEFALAGLAELYEVYSGEADLAKNQAQNQLDGGKLLGWSYSVYRYANEILGAIDAIEQRSEVTLVKVERDYVTVKVAGYSYILSHPRSDQQAAFEQRVLNQFCIIHDCSGLSQAGNSPVRGTLGTEKPSPVWQFRENGAVCSMRGMDLYFADMSRLAGARDLCTRFMGELLTLAGELIWQRQYSVEVDWGFMDISDTPDSPVHIVQLNAQGDAAMLTVPLLWSTPGLLTQLKPWLRATVNGEKVNKVLLKAADFGWE